MSARRSSASCGRIIGRALRPSCRPSGWAMRTARTQPRTRWSRLSSAYSTTTRELAFSTWLYAIGKNLAREFLAGLRARDRAIAELFYGQDFSCAEVARCVGASAGTVKWRLSEIRRRLTAAWEAEHGRS
jgi:DNA-directed RNA polymerase specialized sigma24 family protein